MLLPGNTGASFDGRFHGAKAGGMLDEPQSGTNSIGGSGVATDVERDDGAESVELAAGGFMSGVALEAGIARQRDTWMQRQALRQNCRTTLCPLQAQRQGPDP